MTAIRFENPVHYQFAAHFFATPHQQATGVQPQPTQRTLQSSTALMTLLLQRVTNDSTVILPFVTATNDQWLIAGRERRELDRVLAQISRFIVPTYAAFPDGERAPRLRLFQPEVNRLQQYGAQLYPAGYYRLSSRPEDRDTILERLALWMRLEQRRPAAGGGQSYSYADLHSLFTSALVAVNWAEAEDYLHRIRQLNLTTADNLAFLSVQLLASQHRWYELWERSDYSEIARMRVPRKVREALLTAFYQRVLLPLETDSRWDEAIDTYRQHRARLGLLITGRFGLTHPSVVNVFAYEAAHAGDRESFDELQVVASNPELHRCFSVLATLLPPAIPLSIDDPVRSARLAFHDANYDRAVEAANRVEDDESRTMVLLEIGFYSADVPIAEQALLEFWNLPDASQLRLRSREPYVRMLSYLEEQISPPTPPAENHEPVRAPIQTWLDWFEVAHDNPESPELDGALERLGQVDERYWTPSRALQLSERLVEVSQNANLSRKPHMRQALRQLLSTFMDSSFPRDEQEYADVYESLYICLYDEREVNASNSLTLLRLAEAILRRLPQRWPTIQQEFFAWFGQAIPALESCALDAIEMLAEYGAPGSTFVDWYRIWVDMLLALPTRRERTVLETWLSLGVWVHPDPYLMDRLRQQLDESATQEVVNPLVTLPDGYRIVIFSLRESSASRARDLLLHHNPLLDVRICHQKDLNDQVKALAQNAQTAVIVTTCISHALTYGIAPYLTTAPVYPASSGSSSIVRAIEEHFRQLVSRPSG